MNTQVIAQRIYWTLWGIRSARELAIDCEEHGELPQAERHRQRAKEYARDTRNIMRSYGLRGIDAYHIARKELQS